MIKDDGKGRAILSLEDIHLAFGDVNAVNRVSGEVNEGEILGPPDVERSWLAAWSPLKYD